MMRLGGGGREATVAPRHREMGPQMQAVGEQVEGARRNRLWSVWKVEPAGDAAGLDVV